MNKLKITKTVYIIEWILLAVLAVLSIIKIIDNNFLLQYQEYNKLFATWAAYIFLLTMLPGSFLRFGILKKTMAQLVFWRRALGILMYILGFAHVVLIIDLIPFISQYGGIVSTLTISGGLSLLLLTPVVLTSTNRAQRWLKRNWKTIQRIAYLAIPTLAIHFLQTEKYLLTSLYGITALIIFSSYIYKKYHANKRSKTKTDQKTGIM
ncbi:hypothetical protein GF376_01245 [Candidatus Peregrinibacteria bacterium]|nr:hypothetical protein [Candidatus Peregrinibacteria bacterium]